MAKIKTLIILASVFLVFSPRLKAQGSGSNSVVININGSSFTGDSVLVIVNINILKKDDTIKIAQSSDNIIKRDLKNSDSTYIRYKGKTYKKEFNADGSFKQYEFYENQLTTFKSPVRESKDSVVYAVCSKFIDSIARTKKEILEKITPQNNLPYSIDDGKPTITYEIVTPAEKKTIKLNYPESMSNSLLFGLLISTYVITENNSFKK